MAKTRDIKRRIRSIRSTMQVTRAMKMVSAAKLRRSQERIHEARPYASRMLWVLRSLASRANPDAHPLLRVRPEQRIDLLIVTADKGLCGSFNTSVYKKAAGFLETHAGREVSLDLVGRKGRDHFRRDPRPSRREWTDLYRTLGYTTAAEIARDLMGEYVGERTDAVYIVYNEFKSMIQQRPVVERLLPIERLDLAPGEVAEDYIYEPAPAALFDRLLPRHVEVQVYRALLESAAAENAARMTAMESATNNAAELIESLTLYMNRVRQASITTEIIEVVSGAEAS
jgi:F-type H+-transporting ATPase subunit gamma